jgi:GNAT superfamily N-acetyltransferase
VAGVRISQFERRHVGLAAALAARRITTLREQIPLVPERWTAAATISERLNSLVEEHPTLVAFAGGELVGYMAAMRFEWSQGRWAFSPEWANASIGPDASRIRQDLYAALAEQWVADGYRAHFISLLPDDGVGREALGWLGFGVTNVDGLRNLEPLATANVRGIDIVRAGPADLEAVAELQDALRAHLSTTPLFMTFPATNRDDLADKLADPAIATLLATDDKGPLAFLRIGPHSHDASTIIRDEGTTSITGAFTRADRRGQGVARILLDAALSWARESEYVRCAVDFESANLLASRFWPNHFQIVGITVGRRL